MGIRRKYIGTEFEASILGKRLTTKDIEVAEGRKCRWRGMGKNSTFIWTSRGKYESRKAFEARFYKIFYCNPTLPLPPRPSRSCSSGITTSGDSNIKSRLLRLPAELRVLIYEMALQPVKPYKETAIAGEMGLWWWKSSGVPLIFTCKQIYEEALEIAIRNYTFDEDRVFEKCHVVHLTWPKEGLTGNRLKINLDEHFFVGYIYESMMASSWRIEPAWGVC